MDAVSARFRAQCCDLDTRLDPTAWLISTTSNLSLAALTNNILIETHAALEQLAPDSRLAFLLHVIFDADLAEIAMTLGKTRIDCQSLIEHARRALLQHRHRHAS